MFKKKNSSENENFVKKCLKKLKIQNIYVLPNIIIHLFIIIHIIHLLYIFQIISKIHPKYPKSKIQIPKILEIFFIFFYIWWTLNLYKCMHAIVYFIFKYMIICIHWINAIIRIINTYYENIIWYPKINIKKRLSW